MTHTPMHTATQYIDQTSESVEWAGRRGFNQFPVHIDQNAAFFFVWTCVSYSSIGQGIIGKHLINGITDSQSQCVHNIFFIFQLLI
jgi:hypothetical protein